MGALTAHRRVSGTAALIVCAPCCPGALTDSAALLPLTPSQFNRLERVDVGGVRGRLLTSSVRAVHSDFQLAAQRFQQVRAAGAF